MKHKIVELDSGRVITPPCMLRAPEVGTWRLEHHAEHKGEHVLHCSRFNGRRRIHTTFAPHVFGLTVEIDVVWYRAVRHTAHMARVKGGDYMLAGIFALVPLAFFERFHWAETITQGFAAIGSVFGYSPGGAGH